MKTLIFLINTAYSIFVFLLLIRTVITWIRPKFFNKKWRKLLEIIFNLTEPILEPIRNYIPCKYRGIDFSPVIAFIALSLINNFLINLIRYLMLDIQSIF